MRKLAYLLIYTLLFVLDLLLKLLQFCSVGSGPICLQHLNIPVLA